MHAPSVNRPTAHPALRGFGIALLALLAGLLLAGTLALGGALVGHSPAAVGPLSATRIVVADPGDPCAYYGRKWLSNKVCPPPEHYEA